MKPSRFRPWILLLGLVMVLGGLGAAAGIFRWPVFHRLFGGAEPAAERPGLHGIECLGRIDVEGGVLELAPNRAGRVVAVRVREGERVSVGTVLLRLDEQPARLRIQQAQAALEAAEAQVAVAKDAARLQPSRVASQGALVDAARSRVAAAREGFRRKERQYEQNLIGQEEWAHAREETKALENVARAEEKSLEGLRAEKPNLRVDLACADVLRAKSVLAEAQYELEQCVVAAPESGRLLRVRCGVGEIISPQTAVIVFAPERPRLVRAEVEQELIHLVEVGQVAVVRDEMNPDWSWKGRVTRISDWYADHPTIPRRMARFTDIPTVECVVELDPGHPPLRIGQRMTVNLPRPPRGSDSTSR